MKECNWCKSQVNQDAKICPNCGKRIWEKKHKKGMKATLIFLGIVVLLLILVIVAIANPTTHDCSDATEISLREVHDKIQENHQNAEATYNGNYYILNGQILHVYSNEVQIKDMDSEYSIFVKFNKEFKDDVLNLKVCDTIKYCGNITLTSSTYKMDNACIIKD